MRNNSFNDPILEYISNKNSVFLMGNQEVQQNA